VRNAHKCLRKQAHKTLGRIPHTTPGRNAHKIPEEERSQNTWKGMLTKTPGRNALKILGEERSQNPGEKLSQNPGDKRSQFVIIFFRINILCTFGVSSVASVAKRSLALTIMCFSVHVFSCIASYCRVNTSFTSYTFRI